MRIDRYDPPLIAYEGSIEPGRKVPEWFDAFSTFYWPNQLQAQEEWHQILTPWTESIGVRMGSDLSELQANPAAYARYQPQYDIVRAVTFSNDAIRYVLVQMEFFDEVYRPKGSRAGQTCAFVDSPSGWKLLKFRQPHWLDYLISYSDEELIDMMESGSIPDLDMTIHERIFADGIDVSPRVPEKNSQDKTTVDPELATDGQDKSGAKERLASAAEDAPSPDEKKLFPILLGALGFLVVLAILFGTIRRSRNDASER
jgi:hypothetical protein